ncbi:MAG: hydroxylamine reductase [Planctomycetia bacterium]|nr:hydroxylamine reductase [Planctomycetia bacterium]
MFCWQCQETNQNRGCTAGGRCGKHSETANEMDRLTALLKGLALVLRNGGTPPTREEGRHILQSLFATITNVNFVTADIARLTGETEQFLNTRAQAHGITEPQIPEPGVQKIVDEDICSLCELITYGLRGIAAYAEHAAVLGVEDDSLYAFFVRTLAELADEAMNPDFSATAKQERIGALIQRVQETGTMAVRAMELLDRANTEHFGHPEITPVRTDVGSRPGILVSGHDLADLYELLEQTADQGIDIYTHGEMLPANAYPRMKKFPHLVGNYGGSWFRQPEEFTAFNGPILMTTNCIVPVRDAYRHRIFTTGVVGYPAVKHIADRPVGGHKDFSEIILMAKTCPPPSPLPAPESCTQVHCEPLETLTVGFAHHQVLALADRVVEAVRSGAIRRFIVMAGCDGRHPERSYFTEVAYRLPADTVILTAGCAKYRYHRLPLGEIHGIPRVLDAGQCNDSYSLVRIAMALKEAFGLDDLNQLQISFDIAWYEQKAVAVLLALLSLGVKGIRIGPTLPAFLSPTVLEYLGKTYDLRPITTADADITEMMCGGN